MCPNCDGRGFTVRADHYHDEVVNYHQVQCEWCEDVMGLIELIPYVGDLPTRTFRVGTQIKVIRTFDYLIKLAQSRSSNGL